MPPTLLSVFGHPGARINLTEIGASPKGAIVMAAGETAPALATRKVAALQNWHAATDAASRGNRNLLQYAAGIAALLGISAGSGGVFAVAESLNKSSQGNSPWWAIAILVGVAAFAGTAGIVMLFFLLRAYVLRRTSENEADGYLRELIGMDPDRFWPKAE